MDNILTHSEEKHQGAREKEDLQNSTNKKTASDISFRPSCAFTQDGRSRGLVSRL
jgi:hypothetical protein